MRAVVIKIGYFLRIFTVYWRETSSVRDYVNLLQVRLARSRGIGRFVCPHPVQRTVAIKSLGGPITLRSHTTDVSVLDELLISHSYAHLLGVAPSGSETIVDLGANIGLAARWLAAAFPDARIVAVEPEPGNLDVLDANLARLDGRAVRRPVAVGAAPGRATLTTVSGEHGFTVLGEGAGVEVDVRTLTAILDDARIDRIDVLKCDIEGSEREIFRDCAPWINAVRVLEIECHEPYRLADLTADLSRNGAEFELRDHVPNPAFRCETALFVNKREPVSRQRG